MIDQFKPEAKMVGYWPSLFFACSWTKTESKSMKMPKKARPISSNLDRISVVNKVFIGFKIYWNKNKEKVPLFLFINDIMFLT